MDSPKSVSDGSHKIWSGALRAEMMRSSCWGVSSLRRLAYASCAAAASLKQLRDTQKLYSTCRAPLSDSSGQHHASLLMLLKS